MGYDAWAEIWIGVELEPKTEEVIEKWVNPKTGEEKITSTKLTGYVVKGTEIPVIRPYEIDDIDDREDCLVDEEAGIYVFGILVSHKNIDFDKIASFSQNEITEFAIKAQNIIYEKTKQTLDMCILRILRESY